MITPKHIARDMGLEAKYCRKLIRRKYKRRPGRPWGWTPEEAREVKAWLMRTLNGRDDK
jgi:hypothetical protein